MIAQTNYQHCGGAFEFEAGNQTEFCPHCGKETRVVPVGNLPPPGMEPDGARKVKWWLLWILASMLAICVLIYFLSGWIGNEMLAVFPFVGSAAVGVYLFTVSVITFILGMFWMFFPWFVYFKMERLNRLLEKIEQNTRERK
jgi:hypothetical protein